MAFILDASVAVASVVARQPATYSRTIRLGAKREPSCAGAVEGGGVNVISAFVRRQSLSAEAGRTATDILDCLQPVIHEPSLALTDLYGLAQRYGLSAYDASYLALALELKLPVACTDNKLRAALKAAGVKLV